MLRKRMLLPACVAALVLGLPWSAAAESKVFLNGVDITGMKNQTFKDATVSLDADGNVQINAPQYKVEVQDPNTKAPTPAAPKETYFLVGSNSSPGNVQYDIEVFVNGTLAKTIKDTDSQVIEDISALVLAGTNVVTFKARKNMVGSQKSTSADHTIDFFIGLGSQIDNQLTIEKQFLTFKVDASQVEDQTQNFVFDVAQK